MPTADKPDTKEQPMSDTKPTAADISAVLAERGLGPPVDSEADLARLRAEIHTLRAALIELRDRIKTHPVYAELTEDEESDVGGDTAEFSYLARVADEALGRGPQDQGEHDHDH